MIWAAFPKIIIIFNNKFHVFNLIDNENKIESIEKIKCPKILPESDVNEIFFIRAESKSKQTRNHPNELKRVFSKNIMDGGNAVQ